MQNLTLTPNTLQKPRIKAEERTASSRRIMPRLHEFHMGHCDTQGKHANPEALQATCPCADAPPAQRQSEPPSTCQEPRHHQPRPSHNNAGNHLSKTQPWTQPLTEISSQGLGKPTFFNKMPAFLSRIHKEHCGLGHKTTKKTHTKLKFQRKTCQQLMTPLPGRNWQGHTRHPSQACSTRGLTGSNSCAQALRQSSSS